MQSIVGFMLTQSLNSKLKTKVHILRLHFDHACVQLGQQRNKHADTVAVTGLAQAAPPSGTFF